jgi:hypothetical protein
MLSDSAAQKGRPYKGGRDESYEFQRHHTRSFLFALHDDHGEVVGKGVLAGPLAEVGD